MINLLLKIKKLGIGDWGLGIGDWGLGPIPNPQSPIPNLKNYNFFIIIIYHYFVINKINLNNKFN